MQTRSKKSISTTKRSEVYIRELQDNNGTRIAKGTRNNNDKSNSRGEGTGGDEIGIQCVCGRESD